MGLLSEIRALFSRHPTSTESPVIQCDELGVTQTSATGGQSRLTWSQITAVYAYKRDCFAVDQVRILIGNGDLRTWIEVTEDDPGYAELISDLPLHLPGCPPPEAWFERVAFPPLAMQWTKIYSSEAVPG